MGRVGTGPAADAQHAEPAKRAPECPAWESSRDTQRAWRATVLSRLQPLFPFFGSLD